ncbi:MAG: peptidoglycan editing factor PgeF [gamma proteobacterium symbiont of Bathyaustriella thionipta]|nr:peptidoglycan editing factor PgeF [gamma proteobacterium symbiont of Bathyaustriella thionipta]
MPTITVTETTLQWLTPDWPAAPHVKAFSSTRTGGVSAAPWDSLNLATHVNDNFQHVIHNRKLLKQNLRLPAEPCWLQQTHSKLVVEAHSAAGNIQADGSYSRQTGQVCAVLTADCMPLLMCDEKGTQVAAIHAGWRGMASGILQQAIASFQAPADEILVWMGPTIGASAFEVGDDVYQAFNNRWPQSSAAFAATGKHKYHLDLYHQARLLLNSAGVAQISGGGFCTYSDHQRFYSYRRDGTTGRMASLIWLQ